MNSEVDLIKVGKDCEYSPRSSDCLSSSNGVQGIDLQMLKKKNLIRLVAILILVPIFVFAGLSMMSKRPSNLGVTAGKLAPCPGSPNCASSQTGDSSIKMDALSFDGDNASAMERLKRAVTSIPRTEIITATEDYLHAESTSRLFRFVDDVEFYIDSENQLIHFRSASRIGHSDLGVNRKRMARVKQLFEDS